MASEHRTRFSAVSACLSLPYGLYAWAAFLLLGLLALPLLIVLPSPAGRRRLVRAVARLALWMLGIRLRINGLSALPLPCIIVANHSSYIDGVVMMAALPPDFSFVIKREMAAVPLAGLLLRRIGSKFVDRRDRARSATAARQLLRSAHGGEALAFFPEGTFGDQVGLLRFHPGAFVVAARAAIPLVPVVIHGARRCLPPTSVLPRPGVITIEVLPPLPPPDVPDPAAALRERARAQMLERLGEPDLDVAVK
jgi:1-acyl-sn-glycerol-3-phosphate acyltransferase